VYLTALTAGVSATYAEEAKAAVAANFTQAAIEIGTAFEAATEHTVVFSFGSTGQLYTQITQAAPFDLFLAADQARPERAVAEGFAVGDTRFTYAVGQIVLFSGIPDFVTGADILREAPFRRIAIANPVTAPYGAAAVEVMRALGVYEHLKPKIVQGNTVAQAHQFIQTGNAELGFVALSHVVDVDSGSRWIVPAELYAPIAQDAVLLRHGVDNRAARTFLAFLRGPVAQAIMERYGYRSGS
jgi:molybdate transport system substrate-binding protein